MILHAVPVTEPVTVHGEGPVWDERTSTLRFVDMMAGDVLTFDPSSGSVTRDHVGSVAAALRPRSGGGWVIAAERGFLLDDVALPELWTDPGVRLNDGGCDPFGNFYMGSMAYDETPGGGTLYRLRPDHGVSVVEASVTISNGFGISPDGTIAYYIDTPTGRVDRYDVAAEGLSARRPFVTIDPADGYPDGLTVDAAGGVWVALWSGSAVRRFDSTGALTDHVEVPTSQVTACSFGGDGLRDLYITTSARDLDRKEEPWAGALFRVTPGVAGMPVLPYGG